MKMLRPHSVLGLGLLEPSAVLGFWDGALACCAGNA